MVNSGGFIKTMSKIVKRINSYFEYEIRNGVYKAFICDRCGEVSRTEWYIVTCPKCDLISSEHLELINTYLDNHVEFDCPECNCDGFNIVTFLDTQPVLKCFRCGSKSYIHPDKEELRGVGYNV